jgi:hypothetical protein
MEKQLSEIKARLDEEKDERRRLAESLSVHLREIHSDLDDIVTRLGAIDALRDTLLQVAGHVDERCTDCPMRPTAQMSLKRAATS